MIDNYKIITQNRLDNWYKQDAKFDVSKQILEVILGRVPGHQRDQFLNPKISDIPSPTLLKNMDKAVSLFIAAVNQKKHIVIVGDYDVDGVTSVALIIRFFATLKFSNYAYFIPNRFQHGYGISEKSIEAIIDLQPDLIITVDNGITARTEIEKLKERGIEVLVTDHHTPQVDQIPECVIINPKLADCTFPHGDISGVGVVYLFIIAIRTTLREQGFWTDTIPEPNLLEFLDLVTLGTVADQVPLVGLNRFFVKFGLELMTRKIQLPNPGPFYGYLNTFAQNNNTLFFNCDTINFKIAPLLNAAGRMQDATIALDFLKPSSNENAFKSYLKLEKLNKARKQLQQKLNQKAKKIADEKVKTKSGLVVYDPSFHEGLIGIIANRLSDQYHLPAIVLTNDDEGKLKGSCRSKNQNILLLLERCRDYLIQYGGHANAAGCSLKLEDLEKFEDLFYAQCQQVPLISDANYFETDIEVTSDIVTPELVDKISQMEPFGQGNPKPYFMLSSVDLTEPVILTGNHLKWNLNHQLELIFWEGQRYFKKPGRYKIACSLKDNTFRGVRKAQLIVKTMQGEPEN
jgi:single-stranded-DNA-specific exonuclease